MKRAINILILLLKFYSRRKKEEGRRKKEEAVIAVSAIKNILTVLAVAIMAFSTFFPL